MYVLDDLVNLSVSFFSKRIKVFFYCTLEQEGCLRDVGNCFPKFVQTNLSYVLTID